MHWPGHDRTCRSCLRMAQHWFAPHHQHHRESACLRACVRACVRWGLIHSFIRSFVLSDPLMMTMIMMDDGRRSYYFQREANDDLDFLHDYLSSDPRRQKKLLSLGQTIGTELHPMDRLYSFVQQNLDVRTSRVQPSLCDAQCDCLLPRQE